MERLISELNDIRHLGHFGVELGWPACRRGDELGRLRQAQRARSVRSLQEHAAAPADAHEQPHRRCCCRIAGRRKAEALQRAEFNQRTSSRWCAQPLTRCANQALNDACEQPVDAGEHVPRLIRERQQVDVNHRRITATPRALRGHGVWPVRADRVGNSARPDADVGRTDYGRAQTIHIRHVACAEAT